MSRLLRHFKDRHSNEPDVIRMLLEKDETKQKKAWQVLKNLGNNRHNAEVMWKSEGELVVARAPANQSQWDPDSYAPCDLCFNWFKEDELYRHNCPCKTDASVVRVEVFQRFLASEEVAMFGSLQTAFRRTTANRAEEDVAWRHFAGIHFRGEI